MTQTTDPALAAVQEELRANDTIDMRVATASHSKAHRSVAGKVLIRKAEQGRIAFHCVLLHDFTGGDTEDEIWDEVEVIVLPKRRWRARKGASNNTHGFRTTAVMQFIGNIPDEEMCDFDEVT